PSHSLAVNASTARCCTNAIVSSGSSDGTTSCIPPSSYFDEKSDHSCSSVSMRPGSDATGGGTRLPSTPHTTSMPATNSSTSTFSSAPKGPCRMGKTTSNSPSAASVPTSDGTGSVSAGPVSPRHTSVTGPGPRTWPTVTWFAGARAQQPSRPIATLTTSYLAGS